MLSCTTVASIWLSGFGGMLTTKVVELIVQPSFRIYASRLLPEVIFIQVSRGPGKN